MAPLRNNSWLLARLNHIWSKHFADVTQANPIIIKFGRFSKYRLGSIRLMRHSGYSLITITGMFRKSAVPTEVVDHTLAHELVHYTHGFSSKRVRLHQYPHAGGIVNKELRKRGMGYLLSAYRAWVRDYREQLSED